MAGSITPPKMPLARAQATSSTARSMSWKSIGMHAGTAPRGRRAEVGQPAHVAVQRGPHHLEALVGGRAEIHGRAESARQDRSRQGDLGMDPLLLQHRQTGARPRRPARPSRCRSAPASSRPRRCRRPCRPGGGPRWHGRDRTRRPHRDRSHRTWRWRDSTCRRRRPPPRGAPGPRRTGSGPGCPARRACRPTPRRSCGPARPCVAPSPMQRPPWTPDTLGPDTGPGRPTRTTWSVTRTLPPTLLGRGAGRRLRR